MSGTSIEDAAVIEASWALTLDRSLLQTSFEPQSPAANVERRLDVLIINAIHAENLGYYGHQAHDRAGKILQTVVPHLCSLSTVDSNETLCLNRPLRSLLEIAGTVIVPPMVGQDQFPWLPYI